VLGVSVVVWAVACGGSGDAPATDGNANQPVSSSSSSGESSTSGAPSSSGSSGSTSSSTSSSSSSGDTSSGGTKACTAGTAPAGVNDTQTAIRFLAKGEAPPAANGGTPDGTWIIDKSTLLLPSGASGLVRLNNSSGKASGFAEFHGGQHRIKVHADITITPILGAAMHEVEDMDESGSYTVSGGTMTLKPNCATDAGTGTEQVSFAATAGRGTIVVKIPTQAGDAFFVLEGPKT
jgi:hypothetical protein